MSAYNFLATLKLHDGYRGQTMTVGPKNRIVFKDRLWTEGMRKDALKKILRPLSGYWGDDQRLHPTPRDPDRPFMSFMTFKTSAKILLKDAGLLLERAGDDGE